MGASGQPLHRIFTAVPPRYDLVNSIITWGLDRRWRQEAARVCLAARPRRILDLGCGTGDLAISLRRLGTGDPDVVGLDYSRPMLEIARSKAERLAGGRVSFVHGDATNLPFQDGCFDGVGISFAFRNLTYRNPLALRALAEVIRVLQPGGRFVIAESSQPEARWVRALFHLYLRWFVRRIGYLLSGNKAAYHYLAESAARFYTPAQVKDLLVSAGFREVTYRPLLFGVAGIHLAVK